jgi:2-succinyl-6-hydroxy-2,4-cyclohexadiene-1-carboxylate synthase
MNSERSKIREHNGSHEVKGYRLKIRDVHYQVVEAGKGLPLVLLHGFTGSSENWLPYLQRFTAQYRVLAVDLLGHGKTDSPADPVRYQMDYASADLISIFDSFGLDRPVLLGYSMGGRLALHVGVHYPQKLRGLILESASPGLKNPDERLQRALSDNALADDIEHDGVAVFVERWEKMPIFATQANLSLEARQRLKSLRLRNVALGLANSLRGMGTGVQPSLWEQLSQVCVPTLMLAGELDTKFVAVAQMMQPLLPNAQLRVVNGVGHTIHLEHPEAFAQSVTAFIAGL